MLSHNSVVSSDAASEDDTPLLTIGVVYEGSKVVRTRDKCYDFRAGDLFCLGDGCYHIEDLPSRHCPYKEVALSFSLEELKSFYLLYDNRLTNTTLHEMRGCADSVAGCEADAVILGIFNSLRQNSFRPSFAKRQSILKMLVEATDGVVWHAVLGCLDCRYSHLRSVVSENRFHHTSLDKLAEQCHCSRSTFKALFRKRYDSSPYHYFLEQRLEMAQSLLATTARSISEISEICEFNSPSHFARIFRSRYSLTPSEYRRLQHFENGVF